MLTIIYMITVDLNMLRIIVKRTKKNKEIDVETLDSSGICLVRVLGPSANARLMHCSLSKKSQLYYVAHDPLLYHIL